MLASFIALGTPGIGARADANPPLPDTPEWQPWLARQTSSDGSRLNPK